MSVPFLTRAASGQELEQLRLVLSSFRDGGGQIQDSTGTLPGWRDDERAIATVFHGWAPENKGIFDVFVGSTVNDTTDYGFSVKSKELGRARAIEDLSTDGRVYMELSNSPARLWASVRAAGATEEDFRAGRKADVIGGALLAAVTLWHHEAAAAHLAATGRTLDLNRSAFLVISYSKKRPGRERDYQIHSFELSFPRGVTWRYRSEKSLIGEDPAHPGECLFDWYPFSGGQLKYYPRAASARYGSPRFQLSIPAATSLADKAAAYFPDDWRAAGGAASATAASVAAQLEGLAKNSDDERVRAILLGTADTLRTLD